MYLPKALLLIYSLFVLVFGYRCSAAHCQTIEMQLRPVASSTSKIESIVSSYGTNSRSIGTSPSRGGSPVERVTIGKVGYVDAKTSTIRKTRSLNGVTLFSVSKNTPLAVINTLDKWYGVLMVDGSTGWIPTSDLRISDTRVTLDQSPVVGTSSEIIQRALTYRGIPYVWGGASRVGTDCSGFVKQVWAELGKELPRTAREQATVGAPVPIDQIQPGDRLYFSCKGGAIDHTGLYMGDGQFIHASSGRGRVDIDNFQSWKYAACLVEIRRG